MLFLFISLCTYEIKRIIIAINLHILAGIMFLYKCGLEKNEEQQHANINVSIAYQGDSCVLCCYTWYIFCNFSLPFLFIFRHFSEIYVIYIDDVVFSINLLYVFIVADSPPCILPQWRGYVRSDYSFFIFLLKLYCPHLSFILICVACEYSTNIFVCKCLIFSIIFISSPRKCNFMQWFVMHCKFPYEYIFIEIISSFQCEFQWDCKGIQRL